MIKILDSELRIRIRSIRTKENEERPRIVSLIVSISHFMYKAEVNKFISLPISDLNIQSHQNYDHFMKN